MSGVPRSHLVRFAQLSALWAYAVAQPVFSYMEGNDDLLLFTDSTRAQMAGFALLLAAGPPLAAVLYAAAAGLVSRWAGDVLFLVFLAVFLLPLVSQVVKLVEPGLALALVVILGLSAIGVACYLRWRVVRLFATAAVVLPVLGLASFLRSIPDPIEPARAAVAAPVTRDPVVVVVLDELPLSSLLTRRREIDPVRYPTFARLAREGTWYPRATTVHSHTFRAVPAILTGRAAPDGPMPTAENYPRSLFTLLGGTRPLFVHESQTRLCPRRLCPRPAPSFLGGLDELFHDVRLSYVLDVVPRSLTGAEPGAVPINPAFWRAVQSAMRDYDRFVGDFSPAEPAGSLHFLHLLLPHAPWRYLPSGRRLPSPPNEAEYGAWPDDTWRVHQSLQRHLLQLEYIDLLLGRLVRRLEDVGLYERALRRRGRRPRHPASARARLVGAPTPATFADIASIPLFVKYPGQTHGVADPRAARTVDLLPTVADVLGIRLPWRVEGTSLLGAPPARSSAVVSGPGGLLRAPLEVVERQNERTIRRNASLFGEGSDSLFLLGVHRSLLGREVGGPWPASPTVRVRLEHASDLRHVRKASGVVPAFVEGVVEAGQISAGTELAIAVNGHVRALTRCFLDRGAQRFQALVPESALHDGRNRVDVYAIEAGGSRLVHLGGTES